MNTYITSHKAKVRHLFCFLILCFHLVSAGVPGPCKHSVTQNHFINLRRLIKNQLQNGCSITYTFIERQNLSVVCYVKAAFPHILHLLNTHFRYAKDSDNYRYTNSLKNLIYNIYSQRCIPPINEEIEDNPSKFVKVYMTLPRTALERVEEVLHIYMNLMTEGDRSVDWNCEEEYIEDYPESTSEPLSQTPDAAECPCICPTLNPGSSRTPVSTSQWNIYLESTPSPKESSFTHAVISQDSDGGSGQLKSKIRNQGPKSIPDTSPITVLQNPQLAPVLQTPAPWTSTQGDFSNDLFGSTPGLPDETSNFILEMDTHTPSSDIPLKEIPDFFPRRTDPFRQSALSGPHRKSTKDGTQNILDKSTGLLLAKRSLDSKIHKGLSNTYIRLLQNWIATTSAPITDTKCTGTRKTPTAKDKPFQTLQMNKHIVPVRTAALDSMKTSVDSSEDLTTLVDQPGHPNTPPKTFEIHTHMPKNFLKNP